MDSFARHSWTRWRKPPGKTLICSAARFFAKRQDRSRYSMKLRVAQTGALRRAEIYQGIALVECHNSVCAQVVEIARTTGSAIETRRVVCVVDPGYVVNPAICEAQIEGAVIQGLSAALSGEVTFNAGRVEQSNFHDYPFMRMNEAPLVEVYLLPSGGTYRAGWGGIGETGVPPAAPALVNAIYAATGTRLRSLPVKNHPLQYGR